MTARTGSISFSLAAATVATYVLAACAAAPGVTGPDSSTAVVTSAAPAAVSPAATATTSPTPSPTEDEPPSLAHIALVFGRPGVNMKLDTKLEGAEALDGLVPADQRDALAGTLVEGVRYEVSGPLSGGDPIHTQAHLMTYAFRYPSDGDAADAYRHIVEVLEDADEWEPRAVTASSVLGDESAAFTRRGEDDRNDIAHVWRRADLVLAVVGLDGSDPAAVQDTARRMDERAE